MLTGQASQNPCITSVGVCLKACEQEVFLIPLGISMTGTFWDVHRSRRFKISNECETFVVRRHHILTLTRVEREGQGVQRACMPQRLHTVLDVCARGGTNQSGIDKCSTRDASAQIQGNAALSESIVPCCPRHRDQSKRGGTKERDD